MRADKENSTNCGADAIYNQREGLVSPTEPEIYCIPQQGLNNLRILYIYFRCIILFRIKNSALKNKKPEGELL
jgi:hypothetical protein